MTLTIASWNINSVRLRAGLVTHYLQNWQPDVLCLQETKCPDGQFPTSAFTSIGYEHIAICGQPGYHGVAIISKRPFESQDSIEFCNKGDARHVSVKLTDGPNIHSLYIPAGGDTPDPVTNEKFAHKLQFLDELEALMTKDNLAKAGPTILVGDLNIAPHENDVWSHKQLLKVVSHTPIEVERLNSIIKTGGWDDVLRTSQSDDTKLYSWWSYRAKDWEKSNRGRRLDHIWLDQQLSSKCIDTQILTEARGWERPSDHVPVMATLDM